MFLTVRNRLPGRCRRGVALCVAWVLAGGISAAGGEAGGKGPSNTSPKARSAGDFFEKQIRPVLAKRCWKCHGAKEQEAGLRLDSRAAVLKGGELGPVVVPGKPGDSRLIEVLHHKGEVKMPPEGKLPPAAVTNFERWIRAGLPWPERKSTPAGDPSEKRRLRLYRTHWAFQPVRRPAVPIIPGDDWSRTPIDRFLFARLRKAGLSPSPAADKRTLLRRVTFDLTGLPPTPQELAAFETDTSPTAFAKVVDRLLSSPRYGERWGRHWLDVARYADNKGYVFFEEKTFPWAYTYRDYVIESFNADKPYNRFLLEQLAADQIDLGKEKRALRALGFLTLGGRFMNNIHDIIDDRIDVVARGLLGVTLTCARCHDHKYDPITQADYYSLYGIFRSSVEPTLQPLYEPPPQTPAYRKFRAELQRRLQKLNDFITRKRDALIADGRRRAAGYLLAAYARRNRPPTDNFMLLVPAGELNPTMIHRWQRYLERAKRKRDPVWIVWHKYADIPDGQFARQAARVHREILRLDPARDSVNGLVLRVFRDDPPQSMREVARRYAALLQQTERQWRQQPVPAVKPGEPAAKHFSPALADPERQALHRVFHGADAPPNVPRLLGYGFLSLLPDRPAQNEFKKLIKAVETWSWKGAGAPPRAMTLTDVSPPYQPRVFVRGNPNRLGRIVPRKLPRVVDAAQTPLSHGSGRLTLARAIIHPDNPLTARVIVNRIWRYHFGRGLVTTPSDFGLRSTPPSHPQLLDWLASELIRNGWSLKKLHRQILLSAVYRQQSADRPDARRLDPENRLLWRMNRQRLDFEALRDSLLFVSGRLHTQMGGPPVHITGGKLIPRRTIYAFVDRMNLPPLYRVFDFPSPAATSPRREATTVAPQALYLMNNPFVIQAADALLARPDIAGTKTTAGKLRRLYAVIFQRSPTQREEAAALQYLGPQPQPSDWSRLAHALLMTNEFVFVD